MRMPLIVSVPVYLMFSMVRDVWSCKHFLLLFWLGLVCCGLVCVCGVVGLGPVTQFISRCVFDPALLFCASPSDVVPLILCLGLWIGVFSFFVCFSPICT